MRVQLAKIMKVCKKPVFAFFFRLPVLTWLIFYVGSPCLDTQDRAVNNFSCNLYANTLKSLGK